MKHEFAFLLGILLSFGFIEAQPVDWVDQLNDPNAIFSETVRQAEAYFANVGTGKGTGWKQFQRWKYWREMQVDVDGTTRSFYGVQEEMEKYYAVHGIPSSERRNSSSGSWAQLGPVLLPANGTGQPNGLGRITAIAFHPGNANTIFAATPAGGFWTSLDYGLTWTESSVGFSRLGISSIVVDPTTPNTIYVGTGDRDGGDTPGYGVWRSLDGGATWSPRNTNMGNRVCYEILMHPSNPNILICSTVNQIWRSIDAGATWTSTYSAGEDFKDLAFHPTNPNIIYAAGNDFYRSSDNGLTWTQVVNGVPVGTSRIAIAVTAAQPNYCYLIAGDGGGFDGFYRSTDSGLNFTQRSNSPNIMGYGVTGGSGSQAWYDLVALGDNANADHITIGGVNIWETMDGGTNWSIVAHWTGSGGNPAVHADQHVLEVSPHTNDMFNGNDGGVYYTNNAGVSWTDVSSGMAIAQVYKIGQSQQTRDLVINGYQDNGTGIYRGTAGWWTEIGGDGMECIIDYSDDTYLYGALYYGDIRRSSNGGLSFSGITGGISESGPWVTPYKLHPTIPTTMFVGMNNVWRTTNVRAGVVSWTQISTLPGGSTIRDLAIAPSNPDVMYIARTGANGFYRSNNAMGGSPTWTNLDAGLPLSGYPRDIEIDPTDPTHLWIAMGNNVYESTNSGVSFNDISGTLPNIAARTLVLDTRSTNQALYVGMNVGVYYLDNTLLDWVPFSSGLPFVEMTELEIYYDPTCAGNDMLRAGTYGRGLWESDLRDPGNVAPIACFSASPTTSCVGQVIALHDESAYNPTSWTWTISPATFNFTGATNANSQHPLVQLNAIGLYTITLNATNTNGSDMVSQTNYINVAGNAISLPVSEDFESAALCATTSNCGATTCALPNGWGNETNGMVDDIDWRVHEGSTASSPTGPDMDFNPGTLTGNYVYTEGSNCYNRRAEMISPCIDLRLATNPELTFAYHMLGDAMGDLHVDVQSSGTWTNDVILAFSGAQGMTWLTRTVNLSAFIGNVVRIRFRGITGNGYSSDMALDDISIAEGAILSGEPLSLAGEFLPKQGNQLRWKGSSSKDARAYLIDKQMKTGDFIEIGRLEAIQGKQNFALLDAQPFNGLNVYRLRVQDANGQSAQAGTVSVFSVWDGESISLFPNPHTGTLNLQIQATQNEIVTVQVFDILGQEVFRKKVRISEGLQTLSFNLEHLDPGVYFFRYKNKSAKVVQL
ncbi:MAG TPA: T9SS type A sorting domain-containing protein [Bacteroidetes bacterium]|nr:T9SS type A sorting domain-containing protein [Bacteroidota bacterium]